MSDASLTLDQIIKIKKAANKKKGPVKKQQNAKAVKTTKGTKATVKRLGKNRPLKTAVPKKKITDARNKIIQKKKQSIGDARERLGELARQGDARDRLNKLKKAKTGVAATRIGPQGVKKQNVAGKKQNLVTKKVKQNVVAKNFVKQGKNITRTVAAAPVAKKQKVVKAAANINQDRQVRTQNVKQNMQVRTQNIKQNIKMQRQARVAPEMVWEQPIYAPRPRPQPIYQQAPMYDDEWDAPPPVVYVDEWGTPIRQRPRYVQPQMMRPAPVRRMPVYVEPPMYRPAPVRQRPVYVNAPPQQRLSGMPQKRPQQQQQKPRPQQGHKVLVTKLSPTVTNKDIHELGKSIGNIVNARIVKQGIAEVNFSKAADALRFVEVFHNRQLDGQSMNVRLIKKANVQGGLQKKFGQRLG